MERCQSLRPLQLSIHVSVPLRGLSSWKGIQEQSEEDARIGFSPLAGIKFVERLPCLPAALREVECFSPLAGIKFVESRQRGHYPWHPTVKRSFSPLAGIKFVERKHGLSPYPLKKRFSPLAGIKFVESLFSLLSFP